MYKKKSSSHPGSSVYLPYIVAAFTVVIFLLLEYFFYIPSRWLHHTGSNSSSGKNEVSCTLEEAPVCGKDGKNYRNSCFAKKANVQVAQVGECVFDTNGSPNSSVEIPLAEVSPGEELQVEPQDNTLGIYTVSGEVDLTKYQAYKSNTYKYTLALPKFAFYQGSSTADRKGHRLSIGLSAAEIENSDTAPIRVLYLPKGMVAPPGTQLTFPIENGTISISYDGVPSIKAKQIIETIKASAKSF